MSFNGLRRASAGLSFATLLCLSSGAWAVDARQVADALIAAITASGETEASYAEATQSGADIRISGAKATSKDGGMVEIPVVVVTNAADRDKGGFTADRMTFDQAKITDEDGTIVTWATGIIETAVVPTKDEIVAKARILPFTRLAINGVNISGGELKEPLDIGAVSVDFREVIDGIPHDVAILIEGLTVPASAFADDPQAKATIEQLGYDGFVIGIAGEGGYRPADDTLTFRTITISAADVGKLTITGEVGGMPLSKLADEEKAQEVLATAKINNASIRFENTGIVERILDMQAKTMGATREQFVQQLIAAMPLMLNVIGNPAFQEKLAAAATAFLNAPRSLTFASAPSAPIPVMQIIGAAMSAPQTIPDVLVLDVTAND